MLRSSPQESVHFLEQMIWEYGFRDDAARCPMLVRPLPRPMQLTVMADQQEHSAIGALLAELRNNVQPIRIRQDDIANQKLRTIILRDSHRLTSGIRRLT